MKDKAKNFLEEKGLFQSVASQWNEVEFIEKQAQVARVHTEFSTDPDKIFLYPSLKTIPVREALFEIFKSFGCLLSKSFDKKKSQIWEQRLALPDDSHIGSFQDRLRSLPANPLPPPADANEYSEYKYVVQQSKDPVERLIHIHLSNALIKNNVAPRDPVDVRKWPATEAFAQRKRYYSLLPLTGAYCPQIDCFGKAFAHYAFGFDEIYHTAMRSAMIHLVKSLL